MIEKRLLHRVQAAPWAPDSLDCRDLLASGLSGQGEARQDAASVDMDSTRSTLPDIAALFRSAEIEPLTKSVEKRDARLQIQGVPHAIHVQCQWEFVLPLRDRNSQSLTWPERGEGRYGHAGYDDLAAGYVGFIPGHAQTPGLNLAILVSA